MDHTTNYQLSQWETTDRILMTDFNSDNAKIDAALKASADAVTATNEEDGVALALARYIPGVAEQLKQEGFACD